MERLLRELMEQGILRTPRIIEAFRAVPRESFLPEELVLEAEVNAPLPIGDGQTISQPLTVAIMLELLAPQPGDKVLDVGAGSGWTAALIGMIVGPGGRVFAIERLTALKTFAEQNLKKFHLPQVTLRLGDGSRGLPAEAPFQAIHVAAAAAHSIPPALPQQLAIHGRLVIPVGALSQDLIRLTRRGRDEFQEDRYPGFQFVPLIESNP